MIEDMIKIGTPILVAVVIIFIYFTIIKIVKKKLLKHFKSKKMVHNVKVSLNVFTYLFIVFLIIFVAFYTTGNILAAGITAGLLTAALGWALQRPITGIAAWIMVVVKKPFIIGDRILIGSMKGDVIEITLTHIYLKEIGGTINSEETSGRIVMIPNSVMFEQNIVNYTSQDDFILDEVGVLITYESNLEKSIKICENEAKKIMKENLNKAPKQPYVRVAFNGSGIDIKIRYYVKVEERIKTSSDLTKEVFKEFNKEKDIEIAYPHTEVVLRNKISKK